MPTSLEDLPATRTERDRAVSAIYSANIRAELARRGLTQVQLAEQTGMSIEALRRRMTRGRSAAVWTASELQAVARVLDVTMETLTASAERAGS